MQWWNMHCIINNYLKYRESISCNCIVFILLTSAFYSNDLTLSRHCFDWVSAVLIIHLSSILSVENSTIHRIYPLTRNIHFTQKILWLIIKFCQYRQTFVKTRLEKDSFELLFIPTYRSNQLNNTIFLRINPKFNSHNIWTLFISRLHIMSHSHILHNSMHRSTIYSLWWPISLLYFSTYISSLRYIKLLIISSMRFITQIYHTDI